MDICPHCHSHRMKAETCKGNGSQIASLICGDCNRWVRWLSRKEFLNFDNRNQSVADQMKEDRAEMEQLYLKW